MAQTSQPPVIDIADCVALYGDADTAAMHSATAPASAAEVGRACAEWGFFQVKNHGIAPEIIRAFDENMCALFALPKSTKVAFKRNAQNSRGWFDDELTKRTRDWKEAMDVGQPGRSQDGENQWPAPAVLPAFRGAIEAYYQACARLSRTLMRVLAASLGVSATAFDALVADRVHTSYLRMNYYPLCPLPAPETQPVAEPDPERDGSLGINKHTDAG